MKTTGQKCNKKTGIANTDQLLEFRTPQSTGTAKGAIYDSRQRTLTLKHDVHLVTQSTAVGNSEFAVRAQKRNANSDAAKRDAAPADIRASSAVLRNESRTATLENVIATRGSETLRAQMAVMVLRSDSSVERLVAAGDGQGSDNPPQHGNGGRAGEPGAAPSAASFKAAKLELRFNQSGELNSAEISGGASYQM